MPTTVSSQRRIERMLQLATTAMLVVAGAFCILLLSIRLIVFPQLEAHRAEVARWLSARIGQPVEIDALRTGWDGWNPKLSIRGFRVGDRSAGASPLLDLPRVDLVVAWTSLPLLHLRLKELSIDSPRLWLRRDAQGRLHVAGVEIESEADAGDTAFADWLLQQPRIAVHDALLVWNDDLRAAPQLILDHVEFRLEQRFGHWHIGLTGAPPTDLAAPVDLRADLTRGSRTDSRGLDGRVYLRLDYADIAAWGNWLPLPAPMASGKGALRMWVEMKDSRPQVAVADLELTDVAATLEPRLAPLTLAHLAGRARWKQTATHSDVSAEALSFTLPDGTQVAPMNFSLHLDSSAADGGAGGRLTFDRFDLAPVAALAAAVPLPGRLRDDLEQLAPRGTLFDGSIAWTGAADSPDTFAARGRFDAVGFAPLGAWPGASNLSGSLEADQRHGMLRFATAGATIALPRIFADPIALQRLDGNVEWVSGDEPLTLRFMGLSFANPQLAGTFAGTWRAGIDGPGVADLGAQLTRANFADAWRYVPLAAGASLRTWLHRAITQGTSNDAKLKLSGDLARFPFAAAADGTFTVSVAAKGVNFDYAEGWPAISGMDGTLTVDGPQLSFVATQGSVGDVRIATTHVTIADLRGPHAVLSVDGSATGPTRAFLDFIAASPVAGWIDHVADGATATGVGRLALRLDLPLDGPAPATVAGSYTMTDNAIHFSGAPQLDGMNGSLVFTQDGVHAPDIAAQALGGPARLQIASSVDGAVRVDATGTANLGTLRTQFQLPLLDRVAGNADWRFALTAKDGVPAWSVDSKLVGVTIDLPAPLGKTAASSTALHVERRALGAKADRIVADYAPAGRLLVHRSDGGTGLVADRALVLLGKAAASQATADRPGTWIRGDVAALDVDDWLDVDTGTADAVQAKDALAIEGVDIDTNVTVGAGPKLRDRSRSSRGAMAPTGGCASRVMRFPEPLYGMAWTAPILMVAWPRAWRSFRCWRRRTLRRGWLRTQVRHPPPRVRRPRPWAAGPKSISPPMRSRPKDMRWARSISSRIPWVPTGISESWRW